MTYPEQAPTELPTDILKALGSCLISLSEWALGTTVEDYQIIKEDK